MVTGLDCTAKQFIACKDQLCEPCVLGKQHRLPFPTSTTVTTKPLELVHMDVWGPAQVTTAGGNRYNAIFLDDYTGLSVSRPLPTKSAVAAELKAVFAQLELQSGHQVITVRSDRGGEYLNKDLNQYFAGKGITHQTTAPYTPQQNGAAERLNRTLLERARPMLLGSGLPPKLWAEAIVTANHLRNLSPSNNRDKTPWELFYGTRPDISSLRVFGSTAYALIPKKLRQKLDPVSIMGIFVGYEPNSKAYRILLPSGKITISRDVTFNEIKEVPVEPTVSVGHFQLDLEEAPAVAPQPPVEEGDADIEQLEAEGNEPAPAPAAVLPGAAPAPVPAPAALPLRQSTRSNFGQLGQPFYKVNPALKAYTITSEPLTYEEAMAAPDRELWLQAMHAEMASLLSNCTWTLEQTPPGIKTISAKWVFKLKLDSNGNIERYKARLVAKGFMQREGVDFNEVFAPVSKHTTLRVLLSLVASLDLELRQLDVTTAFLNGDLEETIYMKQPPGFEEGGPGISCHLHRSLYGLRQAPRAWHTKLKLELEAMGFVASDADPGLFILRSTFGTVYQLVYVDDLLLASKSSAAVDNVIKAIQSTFAVRDLGDATYFIGMDITRDRNARTLKLNQRKLTTELVSKYGLQEGNSKSTPLSTSIKLVKEPDNLLDTSLFGYSELVGSLLYISYTTRPDISQAVGALTRFMAAPSTTHWQTARGVVRYLAGTPDYGINFTSPTPLLGYGDADYAGDMDTRRSTTGYVFIFNSGAISWSSRLQPTVAASTTEAEYMAAASTVKEALWLRTLFSDFDIKIPTIDIFCDNQSTIKLLKNPISSQRSKHIDVLHHFARERVLRKDVLFTYISTDKMVADILTKALSAQLFAVCRAAMGISP